jgi:DNA repair protein RadA/Sms
MAKDKTAYVCDNCGFDSAKWIGKCPSCHQWNTFKEIKVSTSSAKPISKQVTPANSSTRTPVRLREISSKTSLAST